MNPQDARPVSPEELPALLSGGTWGSPRVIDLRTDPAFEAGHLPGSSRLGFEEIETAYLRPPRWRPLIVVAEDAIRADDGARLLRGLGHHARGLAIGISRYPGPMETGPELRPAWEPSPLVEQWADRIPRGRICDLACGSGRDAVFLAMKGLSVTAIDVLPDALEQGRALAGRHGVTVDFQPGDVALAPDIWAGPWSGINAQRFLHRPALSLLRERLQPGGLLLYETFRDEQARLGKKPRSPEFLLKTGELLSAAAGLEVLYYREATTEGGDATAALVARNGGERASR
jgi:tellurite methyltransferase